jgi:hypothetical protein
MPPFVFTVITLHDQIFFINCPLADAHISWSMRVEVPSENILKKANK